MRVTPDCDTINSFYIYYDGPTPVQNSPDITFGGGNYFVVWGDGRSLNYQIYGTRVTPAGSVLDPGGILLSRNPNANYSYPSADWGGTRYFVVYGNYAPSPFVLYGRFINTNGSPASDTIRLAAANGPIYHTDVAYSGTNFMVIWVEMPSPCILKGVIVSNNGIPIVNAFTIATGVNYDKSAHVIFFQWSKLFCNLFPAKWHYL
ncbi:MAG: hypothetical protein ABIL39_03605 [candidate division WOR-3 bacterium]